MESPDFLNTDSASYVEKIILEHVVTAIKVNLNLHQCHKVDIIQAWSVSQLYSAQ